MEPRRAGHGYILRKKTRKDGPGGINTREAVAQTPKNEDTDTSVDKNWNECTEERGERG